MPPSTASTTCGRVAVVTGANKGIGYFIALQLGLSGLFEHVILGCRDATRGQAAVDSIQQQLSSTASSTKASFLPVEIGNPDSHTRFRQLLEENFGGQLDVLVNNAALAFKGADPTPFEQQTKPTLDVNFRGTVDFTETLLPLLQKGRDPRLVNVASMAGRLKQLSPKLQQQFASPTLTITELRQLVDTFATDVEKGQHAKQGWSNSNYGMSKLAVIAATKVWARDYSGTIAVNCICPGYCSTDMSSHKGPRSAEDGAKNAVLPATMKDPPTGQFFENMEVSEW